MLDCFKQKASVIDAIFLHIQYSDILKERFAKANVFEAQFTAGLADFVWDKENQPNKINQFIPQIIDKDGLY